MTFNPTVALSLAIAIGLAAPAWAEKQALDAVCWTASDVVELRRE